MMKPHWRLGPGERSGALNVKLILPALTEATDPYWRPIKYSLSFVARSSGPSITALPPQRSIFRRPIPGRASTRAW